MRHRVDHRKLRRSGEHRWAMLRNLVTSLVEHDRVETTLAKGKEARRLAEQMITLGKRGDLNARRAALRVLRTPETTRKLFGDLTERFRGRAGGYTRIVRLGRRLGDGASMCVLEWVAAAAPAPPPEGKKPKASKPKKGAKGATPPPAPAAKSEPPGGKAAAAS